MAYTKFEAKKNIKVYKEMSTSSDKAGTIYKDSVFKAQASTNDNWYRVKELESGSSNGVVEKYYVHQNSSKSNFDTVAGGSSSDATSVSKNYQYDASSVTNTSPTKTTENEDGTETVDTSSVKSVELSEDDIANLTIDDAFFTPYTKFQPTDAAYAARLDEGLRISDIRGVLGIPHQFSSITDPRFNSEWHDDSSLGRVYAEKFIKQMPLLLLTPGVPEFMSEFSDDQKSRVVDQLFGVLGASNLNELIDGKSGKYYSLRFAYDAYFQFVNPMLRTAAYYLNLENKVVGSKSLGSYHWLYDSFDTGLSSNRVPGETFDKFLGPYVGCVAFYANCGNEINESFGNDTGPSQLASTLNSLSDSGRELNFLIGNFGSLTNGMTPSSLTGADDLGQTTGIAESIKNIMGGHGNIFSNILNKATTILAGGRLVFPEIWTDSSFGRSYSCSMKLVSPSGDAFSVYMNILVPLYHLLGFTLPRHAVDGGQAYYSPFLVRAYCKSMFNIDMGIITSLSITKGGEGEWTTDGLFTSLDISFEIKDLYNVLFMSTANGDGIGGNIVSNVTELDYIGNTCGVNINDMEIMRTVKIASAVGWGGTKDTFKSKIFGSITQSINQKLEGIFGRY